MPVKARVVIDVLGVTANGVLDQATPLYITEGIRKADSAISRGLCCIGLNCVWGWKNQDAFWNKVPLSGRPVFVVFDSDQSGVVAPRS